MIQNFLTLFYNFFNMSFYCWKQTKLTSVKYFLNGYGLIFKNARKNDHLFILPGHSAILHIKSQSVGFITMSIPTQSVHSPIFVT